MPTSSGGIVINPEAAGNMIEGAVVDGIGHALFGQLTLNAGKPEQNNFDKYRMIRQNEAPEVVDVHFVQNEIDPMGRTWRTTIPTRNRCAGQCAV